MPLFRMTQKTLVLVVVSATLCACGDEDEGPRMMPTATRTATVTPTNTPVPTATPIRSDLAASANGGGCYPAGTTPNLLDILTLVNPEWAPVVNGTSVDSIPVLIHGEVVSTHGDIGGDYPATHVRSDQVTLIALDAADAGRLATGNFTNEAEDAPPGTIGLEWEVGAYPAWAWAGEGDRIVALGRWIFDCGHPGATVGHCSVTEVQSCILDADCRPPNCATCGAAESCAGVHFGYRSELHPPQATAVIRQGRGGIVSADPGATSVPATRADVFVSGNGGGAGDRCILTHQAQATDLLAVECFPLSQPVAPINGSDFEFDVPLPAQPPGGRPTWQLIDRQAPGGVASRVDISAATADGSPHLTVHVRMTEATNDGMPTGYAGTLFAGWDKDSGAFTHVRLTVEAVRILNALQPAAPVVPRTCSASGTPCRTAVECPDTETCVGVGPVKSWHLQAAVNGEWQELVGLESVTTGDLIPEALVYDQYLPADGTLRLVANGVSEECVSTMLGKSLATDLAELGFTQGLACLASTPRSPGTLDISYPAPDFGTGGATMEYEIASAGGEGGHCATTTGLACVVDADCPSSETCVATGGAFALRYRIERVE
jgi:hypothetical protein